MHNGQQQTDGYQDWVSVSILFHCESLKSSVYIFSATNEDEMCNFYLMYYVDNDEPLEQKYCFTAGPPNYYWTNRDSHLQNSRIPDDDASTL